MYTLAILEVIIVQSGFMICEGKRGKEKGRRVDTFIHALWSCKFGRRYLVYYLHSSLHDLKSWVNMINKASDALVRRNSSLWL